MSWTSSTVSSRASPWSDSTIDLKQQQSKLVSRLLRKCYSWAIIISKLIQATQTSKKTVTTQNSLSFIHLKEESKYKKLFPLIYELENNSLVDYELEVDITPFSFWDFYLFGLIFLFMC